jgi:hypothetical protein
VLIEVPEDADIIAETISAVKRSFVMGHQKFIKRVPIVVEPKVLKNWGDK